MFKKTLLISLVLFMALTGAFANGANETAAATEVGGKLVVWSFTDEVKGMGAYFEEAFPEIEMEYVVIPMNDESYQNKLTQTMRSKSATPDIFTGEIANVRRFVEAGWWENLSAAPYNAEESIDPMFDYVVDLARDQNGNIAGLSFQATPGALFYNRKIAKDVFGNDDPDFISSKTNSMEKLIATGMEVKDAGYSMFVGYTDLFEFYKNFKTQPWIVDNKLVVEDKMIEWFDYAKMVRDSDMTLKGATWAPEWFAGMASNEVFSYILPTWGLHYVMKPNAEADVTDGNYAGNWGLAEPPASYFWGGTWLGVSSFSKNKATAWEFIKFCTLNEDFLKDRAARTGDFVGNEKVAKEIKGDFAESFLAGQNHYEYFYDEAQKIDASRIGPNDDVVSNLLNDQVALYVNGDKSKEEAIADWKAAVKAKFPDVIVD